MTSPQRHPEYSGKRTWNILEAGTDQGKMHSPHTLSRSTAMGWIALFLAICFEKQRQEDRWRLGDVPGGLKIHPAAPAQKQPPIPTQNLKNTYRGQKAGRFTLEADDGDIVLFD